MHESSNIYRYEITDLDFHAGDLKFLCFNFRPSGGVPKRSIRWVSWNWPRPRSTQRPLNQDVCLQGQVPSLTTWPVKTPLQGFCASLEILKLARREPPNNMSISALVRCYDWRHTTFLIDVSHLSGVIFTFEKWIAI